MGVRADPRAGAATMPDWSAGIVAGFAAGAILMVLDLFWSTAIVDTDPWATSRMIAAVAMGAETIRDTGFSLGAVSVALLTHYTMGGLAGLVFAATTTPLRLDAMAATALPAGAVFGAALYLVNFHGLSMFFPWFADTRGLPAIVAHLLFGIATAALHLNLARREAGMPAAEAAR